MSFQQFSQSRGCSSFSVLAKPLLALTLLAGSTTIGATPASAAVIPWIEDVEEGEAEVCLEGMGGAIYLGAPNIDWRTISNGSFTSTPSSLTVEMTISALDMNDEGGEISIFVRSLDGCEEGGTRKNLMFCFSLLHFSGDFKEGTLEGATTIDFDEDTVVELGTGSNQDFQLEMSSNEPADGESYEALTLSFVFGNTADACASDGGEEDGGEEDGGEEDGGVTTGPRFDFSLDSYMQRVTAAGLPDTL